MSATRRTLVAAALLLGLAVALWAILARRDSSRSSDEPTDAAPLVAKPPPTLAPLPAPSPTSPMQPETPAARLRLAGPEASRPALVVRGDDDAPIVGATVHARRKLDVEDHGLVELGSTRADGRWPVADQVAGRWIAVTASGRVPQFLDGDRIDAEHDTVIRLGPGGVVEARVVEADDRTPVAHALVFVEPAKGKGDEDEAEGLSSWEQESLVRADAETGDDGRAVVRVGIAGPVRVEVRPSSWNLYVEPPSVDLPNSTGSVRFRVLAACKLAIHAIDDATGTPLPVPFEIRFGPAATPDQFVGGSTTNPEKTGVFDLFPGLKPDRYLLRVAADGYQPWTSEPVVLERPGASATVEARMKRAASPRWGRIRLTLRKPAHDGTAWYERKGGGELGPTFVVRRTSPNATKWGGPIPRAPLGTTIAESAIRGEERWDAKRRVLELSDVEPARYAIAIFDRSTWSVGGVADIEVLPDSSTDREVDLVAGVRVPIAKIAGDAPSARGIRLFDEHGTEWPAVVLGHGSMVTYDAESRISAGVVLDPVPAERVRVTWRGADGADHEQWLPDAK